MNTPQNCAVEINDLSLCLPGSNTHILKSISLCIQPGERVAIIGPNGAGKTTLIRCLLNLTPNQQGHIKIMGQPLATLTQKELARITSYVPQQLPDNIPFTTLEFIIMSRYAHSSGTILQDKKNKQMAEEAMQRTGITHLANQPMSTLSGGERQKANIAAALARQTPILILDEPSAHLDPKQKESIQQLLASIEAKPSPTLITVTHDLNWAAMHFDRILGMSKGRIVASATPKELITTAKLEQIFGTRWDIQTHPQNGRPMVLPSHHSTTAIT